MLLLSLSPAARGQGWQKAPPVPTDMRDTLSTISKTSNLYLLYQQYRANRDGLQKAAERISLQEAISRGVATNPLLAKTTAEIQAAEWSGVAISREWVPTFTIKTSDPGVLGFNTRTSSLTIKRDGSDPIETISFNHGFQSNPYANLSWAFLDPTRSSRQAAVSSRTTALRNRLTFTTRELILAIQTAYTNLQRNLERERDTIELFNQAIHVYVQAYKEQRPPGEVSRLEAQAVSFLIARIKAHKDSIQSANALANLINLEPGRLALPAEKPDTILLWPLPRDTSIQLALKQREELQANALDVDALRSDARAIRLKVLPALALSGQMKRIANNNNAGTLTGNQSGTISRTAGYDSFAGLTFDWKLFDGGIRYAEADAVDAKAQQFRAQGQILQLQITREVEDAYASFVASKILVDAARADVSASRKSLQGALDDYAAGRHNDAGTTVVQALSKLLSALETYRSLVAEQNTSIYQLHRYTATWPDRTDTLVNDLYRRWLPPTAPARSALPTPAPEAISPLPPAPAASEDAPLGAVTEPGKP